MSALSDLIDLFSKLPGLGPRSARRIVLYLLKNKERVIPNISEMLENLKTSVIFCQICGNIDTSSPCSICSDKIRKSRKVCVVEDIGDLWAIEKSKAYNGRYHVLGGVLSAIDGIGPDEGQPLRRRPGRFRNGHPERRADGGQGPRVGHGVPGNPAQVCSLSRRALSPIPAGTTFQPRGDAQSASTEIAQIQHAARRATVGRFPGQSHLEAWRLD